MTDDAADAAMTVRHSRTDDARIAASSLAQPASSIMGGAAAVMVFK
jgi:hypothetical protein